MNTVKKILSNIKSGALAAHESIAKNNALDMIKYLGGKLFDKQLVDESNIDNPDYIVLARGSENLKSVVTRILDSDQDMVNHVLDKLNEAGLITNYLINCPGSLGKLDIASVYRALDTLLKAVEAMPEDGDSNAESNSEPNL